MGDKYNGWTNYETWVFNLWYDDYFTEAAAEAYHQACSDFDDLDSVRSGATSDLSSCIRETANELYDVGDIRLTGVLSDIITHAINKIDFYEIAEAYIDTLLVEEEVEVQYLIPID